MFCVYKNGSVERVFRGEFKDDTGTYPAAHLRAIGADGRAELNVYLFTDQSKSGYDNAFYVMGEIADAAPDENGDVIRTSTPIERNVNAVKGMMPKNSLGRAMYKKLKIYSGSEHPHAAQQPQPLEL